MLAEKGSPQIDRPIWTVCDSYGRDVEGCIYYTHMRYAVTGNK